MKELFIHRYSRRNAAPVDSLLAIIGPEGTDISGIADNYKAKGSDESTEPKKKLSTKGRGSTNTQEAATDGQRILASPLAKIASDKGIQLTQVKGSGENGRIVKSDVENFTPAAAVLQHQLRAAAAKHRLHCTRSEGLCSCRRSIDRRD
jgi:pyruvate dehydrogenase E2 component (dihydrolipoamide acetyltransferase)